MQNLAVYFVTIISVATYGHGTEEKDLYVVDSIPVIDAPEEGATLEQTDIETFTVVTDKADIQKHGYKDLDNIIFIITKEYARRSGEVKKIPTSKRMKR